MPKRKASTTLENDGRKTRKIKIEISMEVESEDEFGDEVVSSHAHKLSEYEKKRLENIRLNNALLAELKIGELKQELAIASTSTKKNRPTNKIRLKKYPKEDLPRRQSMRLRRISPEGSALPELPLPPPPVNEHPRLSSGPLQMEPVNDIEEYESKAFLSKLSRLSNKVNKSTVKALKADSKSISWHQKSLMALEVKQDHIRKLVPQKVFSVRFHPTQSKTIVLASDTWGRIGLWDVGSSNGNDDVYIYQPHSRPINCMAFDPADSNRLYTCSYDGTIRCADFDVPLFHEVFSLDEDDTYFNYFAFGTSSRNTLMAACVDGTVKVIDGRIDCKKRHAVQDLDLHDKSIKCIDVHPTDKNIFLTTTTKGTIAFWDVRNIRNRKSMLSSVQLSRSTSSAFFSAVSGRQIVATSMSNTVSVHEVSSGIASPSPKCMFRHDNQTRRWLSTFHAVWDPKYDDVFAVGSMKYPRQIDIYSSESKGGPIISLQHENFNTINSRLSFHPTLNMLAGANSSGKVYLWTER